MNYSSSRNDKFKVFMLPWLAHGHITPFLELAKNLSRRNFDAYICSSPVNLKSITNKINTSINLIELHLPDSELPPQHHTTNGLPNHLQPTLFKSLKMAKPILSNLLKRLQPDLLIHDFLLEWAASLASLHKIPALSFSTSGAAMCSFFCHLEQYPRIEFPFPAIHLNAYEQSMAFITVESAHNISEDDVDDQVVDQTDDQRIVLMNSSREIEGKYMDYLAQLLKMEIMPVGAMVRRDHNYTGNDNDDDDDAELIEWLGKKEELSSVFVSFGTEYYLNRDEIQEIAHGLEMSNVNFIWVIRAPKGEDKTSAEELLPEGFLDRVGERGKIVEKWAPQAKILRHTSIGGFVSHCGWNSLLESIDVGVPIIAMPMHLDQPLNAKLMVEIGVGMEVKRDDNGRLQREEIGKVIKDVILFGKTGQVLSRQVIERRESVRARRADEMERAVLKLNELCGRKRQA